MHSYSESSAQLWLLWRAINGGMESDRRAKKAELFPYTCNPFKACLGHISHSSLRFLSRNCLWGPEIMKTHQTYCKNSKTPCWLFRTPNQAWKIAFGSIGAKKTAKFDGFAKTTRIANAQIAAISNRSDFKLRDADLKSRDAGQLSI